MTRPILPGMATTTRLFLFPLFLGLASCGEIVPILDAAPADASLDAQIADVTPVKRPPDARALDAAPTPDAVGCVGLSFADLPNGYLGETALVPPLGTLRGARCLGEDCEPARLYVGDQGLGIEGTLLDGDGVAGLDHVHLVLDAPARVGYRVHRGQNRNADPGIYHHVEAYLGGAQVLGMMIDAREFELELPLADEVVWSGVVVGTDAQSFADGVTLDWAHVCP